ncbi:MAG TPA: phosphopantothenoylcysteine decarboxylase, partial [Rhodocyclaceae bacterium]|nr:phosphopantothenoylcysteine decarboxylase [Rhodocyclaceae bacterium]
MTTPWASLQRALGRVRHARRVLSAVVVLVMAAAPADFRPVSVAGSKIKKAGAQEAIALAPTPDILRDTRSAR